MQRRMSNPAARTANNCLSRPSRGIMMAGSKWGHSSGRDDAMSTDDVQTTERSARTKNQKKPAISDPRDDLREQVAAYRRDLQSFFAHRVTSPFTRRGTKRVLTH